MRKCWVDMDERCQQIENAKIDNTAADADRGKAEKSPKGAQWFALESLAEIPLGTTARKALRLRGE